MPASRWIKRGFLLLVIGGLLPLIYLYFPGNMGLPSFAMTKEAWQSSDQKILDRHGQLLGTTRIDKERRRLDWLPLDAVAPVFLRTLLAVEDQRFREHGGIDGRGFAALLMQKRGGSTLTMQLAAQLQPAIKAQGKFRRPWQKLQQLRAARILEKTWSKDQILEAYINLVSFRGELQGLGAASQALMQKDAHGLTAEESLLLVSALGLPTARAQVVALRACRLAGRVNLTITCAVLEKMALRTLDRAPKLKAPVRLAPHLAALLNELNGELRAQESTAMHAQDSVDTALRSSTERMAGAAAMPLDTALRSSTERTQDIHTTLDRSIQELASKALESHLAAVTQQNVHDGAVLVIDNRSAEVLAYVGSSAVTTKNPFVDMARGLRQAGSSLKPLLYASAIDQRLLTAASLLDDKPISMPTTSGLYVPKNYDEIYHGTVTAREALASSLNIPAVRVIDTVGVAHFVSTLGDLGFTHLQNTENYGHSLALGAADISPWELAGAYLSLAHGGVFRPLKALSRQPEVEGHRWISAEAAFVIGTILSDRSARSLTFGLENPLATPFWTAVKTGTSKDMRDNWCAGYSSRYTVVVWVGNADGSPMWSVTGITGAAPVWRDVMNSLHAEEASGEPAPPAGVAQELFRDGRGQQRRDWFLTGTGNEQQKLADRRHDLKILHPLDGTLVAFDPDIPETQQALFFEANAPLPAGGRWVLDQKVLGKDHIRLGALSNGRHRLEVQTRDGRRLDGVSFEVRGNAGI